jgi:hypothetical protein
MKKSLFAFAAAAAVAAAGTAQAQVCAGFPIHDNQGTISARADFPSGADQYGVEGAFNFTGPLSLNAGYVRTSISNGGGSLDTFRAGAALDISSYTAGMLPGVSVCPNVRADFTSQDQTNLYEIPVGLGLGVNVPLGDPTMTLTPYVIPAIVFSRFTDPTLGNFNETDFGVRGGADVNFDRFYLGGQVEWVNTTGSKAVFGVRGGIKF